MRCIIFCLLLLSSCDTMRGLGKTDVYPLDYSMLPQDVDYSIFDEPKDPSEFESKPSSQPVSQAPVFDPVIFLGCSDDKSLPAEGILIDEKTFASNIANLAELKRLRKQLTLLKALRIQERKQIEKAEKAYQARIVFLEKEARPDLWERIDFQVGLGIGLGVTVITVFVLNMAQYGSISLVTPRT